MKIFTQQEKKVILFLSAFFVVGIIIGTIRNKTYFFRSSPINHDESGFKSLAHSVYNDKKVLDTPEPVPFNTGLININNATKDELISLPKIGPVTAERIIRYREDYGKFSSVNELKNVKGIGEKTMEQIFSLITTEIEEKTNE